MRLSLLFPVYNVAVYLPELLSVVLPQLSSEVELIFYDDASSDTSANIIQQAQTQYSEATIRLLQGKQNIGVTQARKILLEASEADYIWYIDPDDLIEAEAIAQILSILNKYQPDVLLFDYDVFFDESNIIKQQERLKLKPTHTLATNTTQLYRMAILDGKHYFWNKVFRRCQIMEHSVPFNIPTYEDIAYTPVLLSYCRSYYYLSEVLLHYRIRQNSIVQKLNRLQAYGIQAYIYQACYAHEVMKDQISRAYLLYKACIYYFRLKTKFNQLSVQEREELIHLSEQFYTSKNMSEWQIIYLLLKAGMYGKACKLLIKNIMDKIR